jgi:2',3'-cyclic-nucleotide 2'-phosphodiesterase/3'-nucleotidase
MVALPATVDAAGEPAIQLRLLGTSDLHMFVDDYDYYRDRPDETVGFAKTATLIEHARAEVTNSLLFDNGDLIQGSPLGDFLASGQTVPDGTVHPMIAAMNRIAYDAGTIGNHEFNFGLGFLERVLSGPTFPMVSANVTRADGTRFLPPWIVLERTLLDTAGTRHTLRVGVIGFVTPQIVQWDRAALNGKLMTQDIVDAAQRHVPALARSCDLVVALCHSGISASPRQGGDENAALYLAAVPGIDAILTGHSHRVFPGPDYAGHETIDAARGSLSGVPAVMPGFWGSHLGIIDLTLKPKAGRWNVADFRTEARPIYRRDGAAILSLTDPAPPVVAGIEPAHRATIAYMQQPVGRSAMPITSYFALIGDDPATALINRAQIWYAAPLLAGTTYADLPLLSAAAPFKAGGGAGPDNYTEIPAGPIARRNVADLYIFPNMLRVVVVTGADLKEWLEKSAALFNRLDPAAAEPQSLQNPHVASYNFDVIAGLDYTIDPTRPARYGADAQPIDPTAERVANLTYRGRPIDAAQRFAVVTNNYRADGGGKFPALDGSKTILEAPDTNRDVLSRYIAEIQHVPATFEQPWRFGHTGRTVTALFETGKGADTYRSNQRSLESLGVGPNGFMRYTIRIG